jgi:hypothetical protein
MRHWSWKGYGAWDVVGGAGCLKQASVRPKASAAGCCRWRVCEPEKPGAASSAPTESNIKTEIPAGGNFVVTIRYLTIVLRKTPVFFDGCFKVKHRPG